MVNTDWIILTGAIMGVTLLANVALRMGVADLALSLAWYVESSLNAAQY